MWAMAGDDGAARLHDAGVEIDRQALGERVARARPG
jgi:hypothetical protein